MKCCPTVRARVRGQGRPAPVTPTSCPSHCFPKPRCHLPRRLHASFNLAIKCSSLTGTLELFQFKGAPTVCQAPFYSFPDPVSVSVPQGLVVGPNKEKEARQGTKVC